MSVAVVDRVSGLAGGRIEISRAGPALGRRSPPARREAKLVARIDDSRYPPGQYAVRTRAADQAGNEASTDRRADGRPMIVTLPLRVAASMRAGIVAQEVVAAQEGPSPGRAPTVTVLAPAGTGALRAARSPRRPTRERRGRRHRRRPGARLLADTDDPGEARRRYHALTRSGRYRYIARASSSGTFRFVYEGTGLVLPAQREVRPARAGRQLDQGEPPTAQERRRGDASAVDSGSRRPASSSSSRCCCPAGSRRSRPCAPGRGGRWAVRYRFTTVLRTVRLSLPSSRAEGGHISVRDRTHPVESASPCAGYPAGSECRRATFLLATAFRR